jgi:hypothetical protein
VQTDATRTCELLVDLRDVTVLGVDERLRQPDEVCVDLQHPWIHRPIAIPEGSGVPVRCRHQSGACPRSADRGQATIASATARSNGSASPTTPSRRSPTAFEHAMLAAPDSAGRPEYSEIIDRRTSRDRVQ